MTKKIMILLFLLMLTSLSTPLFADNMYWNFGDGGLSFDFTKDDFRMGGYPEFLRAKVLFFEDAAMPRVVDLVHVRAGFWTQNLSFCVTVGIDLTTIILCFNNN